MCAPVLRSLTAEAVELPMKRPLGTSARRIDDPNEISAIKPYDDEAIQQLEADGRDHEKVHGGNVWRVVSQKGRPALARRSTALDHVLSDARLRDLKPKLEQFAVNARRTPKQILHAHLADQRAQFCLDLRAASS